MIRRIALRHLAAYGVSLPTLVATAKVAKETVYMPSAVAAQVLGSGAETHVEVDPPHEE